MLKWDYNVFWKETLDQIKKDLIDKGKEQEFTLWFEKIEYVSSLENSITLSVPSLFYFDQLKQRGYIILIEKKLKELSGNGIVIETIVRTNPQIQKKEEQKAKEVELQKEKKQHPSLRADYTFDSFVRGENNSFAYNAGIAISKNPGRAYNPVLIYGGVGLGKTHLMQAIGNLSYQETTGKIIYITAEDFTNEFIQSVTSTVTMSKFKNKYRSADILLIDDIHFLQNKEGTQEELFHTFKALYESYKQMVFTCDRPLSDLKNLSDRLKSRFGSGLNVDLQPPNYETRRAILEKKVQERGIHIPEEVLDLIAQNISTNVRDLESSLTKLIAYAELVNKEITLEIAQNQLRDSFGYSKQINVSVEIIQKAVAEYFNISYTDLKGKKRTNNVVLPRQLAMYIAREMTEYSTTELGAEFGGRDHTTVMHACKKIQDALKSDPTMENMIESLHRSIKDFKK